MTESREKSENQTEGIYLPRTGERGKGKNLLSKGLFEFPKGPRNTLNTRMKKEADQEVRQYLLRLWIFGSLRFSCQINAKARSSKE
jgi:hypothetical protein